MPALASLCNVVNFSKSTFYDKARTQSSVVAQLHDFPPRLSVYTSDVAHFLMSASTRLGTPQASLICELPFAAERIRVENDGSQCSNSSKYPMCSFASAKLPLSSNRPMSTSLIRRCVCLFLR